MCTHKNAYAWAIIESKQTYANKQGAWTETTIDEL